MPDKTVAQKMFLKPGHRAFALNAPRGYTTLLGGLPEGAKLLKKADAAVDFVHLFVRDQRDLARDLPAALAAVGPETTFWVSYPKKTSSIATDISRDVGWEPMTAAGYEPVTIVAVDENWSALRFKPSGSIPARAARRAATGLAKGRKRGHDREG